jgi:hypothetical protein
MQTRTQREARAEQSAKNQNLRCWCSGEDILCLRIELSDGTQFMRPYGYFEGARFSKAADEDFIDLQFKSETFRVKGRNLSELFFAFQKLSVEFLKEQPSRYRPLAQKAEGFIEKIDIKHELDAGNEQSEAAPENSPS